MMMMMMTTMIIMITMIIPDDVDNDGGVSVGVGVGNDDKHNSTIPITSVFTDIASFFTPLLLG